MKLCKNLTVLRIKQFPSAGSYLESKGKAFFVVPRKIEG
ncbi:hypothetical protein C7425_104290 [Pantoea ananatis]|nr:hypothetical protein C7425_104290 [Pantoea ananatis]